jgi:hypothetical protein
MERQLRCHVGCSFSHPFSADSLSELVADALFRLWYGSPDYFRSLSSAARLSLAQRGEVFLGFITLDCVPFMDEGRSGRYFNEERADRKMSEQYFYVRLKFIPKFGMPSVLNIKQHEAAVEVPKGLVQRKQSELINENSREKAIALDFARRAALAIFSTGVEPIVWPYDEEALWCEDRHPVMNERPCDHEENGTRAWRVVEESLEARLKSHFPFMLPT